VWPSSWVTVDVRADSHRQKTSSPPTISALCMVREVKARTRRSDTHRPSSGATRVSSAIPVCGFVGDDRVDDPAGRRPVEGGHRRLVGLASQAVLLDLLGGDHEHLGGAQAEAPQGARTRGRRVGRSRRVDEDPGVGLVDPRGSLFWPEDETGTRVPSNQALAVQKAGGSHVEEAAERNEFGESHRTASIRLVRPARDDHPGPAHRLAVLSGDDGEGRPGGERRGVGSRHRRGGRRPAASLEPGRGNEEGSPGEP